MQVGKTNGSRWLVASFRVSALMDVYELAQAACLNCRARIKSTVFPHDFSPRRGLIPSKFSSSAIIGDLCERQP
jgi:hypothetical protein